MTYHWLIPLFAAVATVMLAIVVIRKAPHRQLNQVFAFLAGMLVLWNLNFFALYSVSDRELAFTLSRVFRVGAILMWPAMLHFALVLRERRSSAWWTALGIDYLSAFVLTIANAFDLLISDVHRFTWGYYSVGTHLYSSFAVFLMVNLIAVVALLVHDYRTSMEPRTRLQLKFWVVGALVALPLGCTNLLPAYGISFYPLGNLGNAAWAAIVAYAIVRHRLMDVDLVVTKGMAYAAVSFVLVAPAFLLTLWLQRLSFGRISSDFSFAILVMLIAVGVLFPAFRIRAESRIQRSLFREKHEYRAALIAFSRSITRILDRDRLVRELSTSLSDALRLDRIAVVLHDETKRSFTLRHALGIPPAAEEFPEDNGFVLALARCQGPLLREELEVSAEPKERSAVAETCRRNGWEVCIPLTATGKLMGFISLGRKRNLDAFFAEDLELLGTLAAEASVALENARLYEELKKSQDIIRRADRLSALGTLAAGIAHEVRNPLVSIQTFFQLAPDRLHDEEFFTTFLGMTAKEVKRISDLITELLSFARAPTPSLRAVNLNETVDRVVTLLEPQARKHKLAIIRDLSPTLPTAHADSDQIKQVLINLVLNAIQATQPGGTISITTRSVQHRNATVAQLEVRDTGSGIPPAQLDHIFNPFFTTKEKGTGLGLAIAHQIVAEHGGRIAAKSEEKQGTSFFVDLPASGEGTVTVQRADAAVEEPPPRRLRKVAS